MNKEAPKIMRGLANLESLMLRGCEAYSDAGLACLDGMISLTGLHLDEAKISDWRFGGPHAALPRLTHPTGQRLRVGWVERRFIAVRPTGMP